VIARSDNGAVPHLPNDFALYIQRLRLGLKTRRYCGAGRTMVVVAADGDCYPCLRCVGDRRFAAAGPGVAANGDEQASFRNPALQEKAICRRCWARNLCGGGCAVQALYRNGDVYSPDPVECAVTKNRIEGAIAICHHFSTNDRIKATSRPNRHGSQPGT
jgi:uncharacterized protein